MLNAMPFILITLHDFLVQKKTVQNVQKLILAEKLRKK